MQVTIRLGCVTFAALLTFVVGCSSEPATQPQSTSGGTGGAGTGGSAGGTPTGGAGSGGATTGGAGSGGASGGGSAGAPGDGSTGRPTELPSSDSQADIAAFLASSGYKGSSWISETAMPRAGTPGTQHSSKVRVWENAPLVASLKGGWTYSCYGPENRCSSAGAATKEMPVYGKGSAVPGSNCGFCHGFSIYTIPP